MNSSPFKPEARAALEQANEEALAEENPKRDVQYPARVKTEVERVGYNAEILAAVYEGILPERGIGQAFRETLVEIAEKLQEAVQQETEARAEPRHPRFFRYALNEVRVLSEVDRLLSEGNSEHLEITTNVTVGDTSTIRARLTNVFLDEKKWIPVKETVWHFEPQGIRLSVSYRSPATHRMRELEAHMDFHPRGKKDQWHNDSKKQAAIDFNGTHITPALRELKEDYHRSKYLDRVLTNDEDFRAIREGRLEKAREKIGRQEDS